MDCEARIDELMAGMTLAEKVGQMRQISGVGEACEELIRRGAVGFVMRADLAQRFQGAAPRLPRRHPGDQQG